jgi:hypothetical protein
MNNFVKPIFKVYLYRYKPAFYTGLQVAASTTPNTGTATLKLSDIDDTKLSDSAFLNTTDRAKYSDEFDLIFPTKLTIKPETTQTSSISLRDALKESYIVQRLQQTDPLNWLNTYKNDYPASYKKESQKRKVLLGAALDRLLKSSTFETYLERKEVTSDNLDDNSLVEVRDFVTSLNAIDNGLTVTFDARKLNAQNRIIVENDVLELVISYPDEGYQPRSVFFGFVTNVAITERFGNIVDYTVSCAGLGKYLMLSRIIQNPAIVSQFESGVDVYDVGLSPFETLFNNKEPKQIFDEIMSNALGLTSEFQAYADAVATQYSDTETYNILDDYVLQVRDLQPKFLSLLSPQFKNGKDDVIKKLRLSQLTPVAETIERYYRESGEDEALYLSKLSALLGEYKAKYDRYTALRETLRAQGSGKAANIAVPYQLFYKFPFSALNFQTKPFQFALLLLTLIYCSRKWSADMGNTNLRTEKGEDVFALFTGANEDQYKVYNIMARTAFDTYYSQVTAPDDILSDLRNFTFFELFEDRPGIIKCRPPRYNVWQGDELDPDNVLDLIKQRDDSRLMTFMAYKFMFPYSGTVDFMGGKFMDLDMLVKYGLRAETPRQNPNVLSPELGNYWSAMDLIRANMSTRVVNVVVPATKEYKLGTLYFIPNMGLTDQDIKDLNPKDGERTGIIGYVNNINTSINPGEVSTHTLELIYVRKCKTVGVPASGSAPQLNFTRIPDLEMFMQFIETVNKEWDLTKTLNKLTAAKTSNLSKWNENAALSVDGVYYAVNPDIYDAFQKVLSAKPAEYEEMMLQDEYAHYVAKTGFRVSDFGPVSQELVNRLYLLDLALRNKHEPHAHSASGTINLNLKDAAWQQKVYGRQAIQVKHSLGKPDVLFKAPALDVNAAHTAVPVVLNNNTHNAEFAEFRQLRDLPRSDLELLLDYLFITSQAKLQVTDLTGTVQDLALTNNDTRATLYETSTGTSLYYRTSGRFFSGHKMEDAYYDLAGAELGLYYIPDAKRYSIESLASSGALKASKDVSEVDDTATNAHLYGLEVDIFPELQTYWSLADLETSLTFGLHLKDKAINASTYPVTPFEGRYTAKPIFDFYNDTEKETYYVKMTPVYDAIFADMQNVGSKLGLIITKGTTSQQKSKVTAAFDSLIRVGPPDNPYQYVVNNAELETIHIQVDHRFKNDPERHTTVPVIDKPIHFVINYRDGNNPPAGANQLPAKERHFKLDTQTGRGVVTEYSNAEALVSSRKVGSKVPITKQQITEKYQTWFTQAAAGGLLGGAATSGLFLAGAISATVAAPLSIVVICITGVGIVGATIAQVLNKSLMEHPYLNVVYWFEDKTL